MCGFTGLYTFSRDAKRSAMQRSCRAMNETLVHRGPDGGDVWQDPDAPLALGHRRLSIIDLSPAGRQPMSSASERYVIAYNGEIYNYPALRTQLESAGAAFHGRSDTEVLLAAIEKWGLNLSLQKLVGMFAFALWDRKERALHLVRDPLGKKPLYAGWAGDTLVFGSELKALRAHPDFKPAINKPALALMLRHGYMPAPHCIYDGVWALPAGFRLKIQPETLKPGADLSNLMEPYWHHKRKLDDARGQMIDLSDEAVVNEFEELLSTCVQDRLVSDVPLGAFLSGGIDSSAVVALMQKRASAPVKTYCIGFHEQGFDEAKHAKAVASHLGTDHHELYVDAKAAMDVIPALPEMYDEPFADISAIPTYLVSRFARRDVTVALSGDGGDEMLGGYNRHFMGPKIWKRAKIMPGFLRRGLAGFVQGVPTDRWDALNRAQPQFGTRLHKAASILSLDTREAIYQRLVSQWERSPVLDADAPDILQERDEWSPDGLSFAEAMMYWDGLGYLPGDILTKVDRASMAVSLEVRAPLLDRRIYEYVWRLPERFKIRGGQGKWLLRQVLHRHVPKALFERPKQGFTMPVGEWLRGDLRSWAEGLLSKETLEKDGLFDVDMIASLWQDHLDGRGNHAAKLWSVLMVQAWKDKWM